VSTDRPLTVASGRTLPAILRDGAARQADRPLLIFENASGAVTSYTWRQIEERSHAVAARLRRLGVKPRDRLHLHLPNRPEFLLLWFAAAHLRASMVPTNTAATADELAYILGHAEPSASVTDSSGRAVVTRAREQVGSDGPLLDCDVEDLLNLDPEPAMETASDPNSEPHGADELAVMYTSGTTSNPKGVQITHANYIYAGEVVASALRLGPDDRFLTVLPLFHANAQYYSTMGTLIGGGTLVLAARFSASRLLEQAVRHEATLASLFAAPMRMVLAQQASPRWREHRLRVVVFAQNLTQAEYQRWDELIGAPLLQLYGMTETIGPPVMNPLLGPRRHDTLGRPVLGYECQVVREDGTPTDVEEPGELLIGGVPGVSLMNGYLHDPEATAAALQDGWLRTGDVVSADRDGFLSFVDRRKDMIKRAGENIAASEVEAVLLDHPHVSEAAVVGVPDRMRDEQIIAFVVLDEPHAASKAEMIEWCAQRLSKFRIPSGIKFREELPRTAVGKIQKHHLRADYISRQPEQPARAIHREDSTR